MKSEEELLIETGDKESSSYCGTAVFLSLLPLLDELTETTIGFEEGFGGTKLLILRLAEEDGKFFALSKQKEISASQWDELINIIADYGEIIGTISEILMFLHEIEREEEKKELTKDFIFLSHLLSSDLSPLYERTDQPKEFFSTAAMSLAEIQEEIQ